MDHRTGMLALKLARVFTVEQHASQVSLPGPASDDVVRDTGGGPRAFWNSCNVADSFHVKLYATQH